jgi:hypothetical protein
MMIHHKRRNEHQPTADSPFRRPRPSGCEEHQDGQPQDVENHQGPEYFDHHRLLAPIRARTAADFDQRRI